MGKQQDIGLSIYIDRLYNGSKQSLDGDYSAEAIGLVGNGFRCDKPITVTGEAYIAGEHLVVHYNVATDVVVPCAICNEDVVIMLAMRGLYETIALDEVKHRVLDFSPMVREAVFLEIPQVIECHDGCCPHREELDLYLKH